MWDRGCVTALGVLLVAGAVAAETHGEGELGEVCAVLGGLFLAVAVGMWGVPGRLTGRASAPLPEMSPPKVGATAGGTGSTAESSAAPDVQRDASPAVRRRRPRA